MVIISGMFWWHRFVFPTAEITAAAEATTATVASRNDGTDQEECLRKEK